jgi:hypothetical protein
MAFVNFIHTKLHTFNLHHHDHHDHHSSGVPLLPFQAMGCFSQIRNAFMPYASLVSS